MWIQFKRYKGVLKQLCFLIYLFPWYSEKLLVAELTFGMAADVHALWSFLVFPDIKLLYDRKGDTNVLSFLDFYLFEVIFFMYINLFLMLRN